MEETKNKVKEWSIEKDYQEGEKILLNIAENIKKKVSNNEDLPKKMNISAASTLLKM